ncbi:MAG TPA: hypothetical protein VFY28_02385 [Candidatus Paceibacterota bacterium]|nr:hypothetical protein [Candidatus Paceibacterota bacterium]
MKRLFEIATLFLFLGAVIGTQFWMADAFDTGSPRWPAVVASIYVLMVFVGLLASIFDPKAVPIRHIFREGLLFGIVMTALFVVGYGANPEATTNFFGFVDAAFLFAIFVVGVLSVLERLNVGTSLPSHTASAQK